MDLKLVIGFIASHYIVIFGTTLALFFTACMILLIRSIGNKNEDAAPTDLNAIEGAMRRVLQSQPVSIAAGSKVTSDSATEIVVNGEAAPGQGDQVSSAELEARDAKIAELSRELEAARATAGTSDADDPAKLAMKEQIVGLSGKLDEAQARLAEYEIIEDDIADLSKFKDENVSLKKELEKLKAQAAAAPTANALSGFEGLEAEAAVAAVAAAVVPAEEMKFEKVEKFELNPDDDVMKEFAAAVDGLTPASSAPESAVTGAPPEMMSSQAEIDALLSGGGHDAVPVSVEPPAPAEPARSSSDAALDAFLTAEPKQVEAESGESHDDPLAGAMDADKMLSEVQTLAEAEHEDSALDDTLDTDKLLAEVDSLKNGAKSAS